MDSIHQQSFDHYEVLVVDGLSTDGTMDIVRTNATKNPRILYVSEKDYGVYDAMNKGIRQAKGEWILFLGSDDDLFDDDVLQKAQMELVRLDSEFVYGNVITRGDSSWAKDQTVYDGVFTVDKLLSRNICHQGIFYRRIMFDQTGFFDIRYTVCADWDMNHRFFARNKTQYIPHIISNFNAGGTSTHTNHDLFTDRDCVFNIRKYYKIGYFNKLFHRYHDIFYRIAREALGEKAYVKSGYYFSVALFHSDHRYQFVKASLRSLLKK